MVIAIIVLLILLVIALIAVYIKQEDNDAQANFIEHQGAVIDRMRPHLSATYWLTYTGEQK